MSELTRREKITAAHISNNDISWTLILPCWLNMLVKTSNFPINVNQNWGSGTIMKRENHLPLPGEFACRVCRR